MKVVRKSAADTEETIPCSTCDSPIGEGQATRVGKDILCPPCYSESKARRSSSAAPGRGVPIDAKTKRVKRGADPFHAMAEYVSKFAAIHRESPGWDLIHDTYSVSDIRDVIAGMDGVSGEDDAALRMHAFALDQVDSLLARTAEQGYGEDECTYCGTPVPPEPGGEAPFCSETCVAAYHDRLGGRARKAVYVQEGRYDVPVYLLSSTQADIRHASIDMRTVDGLLVDGNLLGVLDLAFTNASDEFQPQGKPGIADGDVIDLTELGRGYHLVANDGQTYKKLSEPQFQEYIKTPQNQRSAFAHELVHGRTASSRRTGLVKETVDFAAHEKRAREMDLHSLQWTIKDIKEALENARELSRAGYDGQEGKYADQLSIYLGELRRRTETPHVCPECGQTLRRGSKVVDDGVNLYCSLRCAGGDVPTEFAVTTGKKPPSKPPKVFATIEDARRDADDAATEGYDAVIWGRYGWDVRGADWRPVERYRGPRRR